MSGVERDGDRFVLEAQVVARAFGLSPEETRRRMREGQITSLCEAGEEEHAGRWRLTFRHQGRALRLVVDEKGEILNRSTFPIGAPRAPTRAR